MEGERKIKKIEERERVKYFYYRVSSLSNN